MIQNILELKQKIKLLQSKYPNWKFKILYTGLDWNDVISSEYTGHGSSPKNLIYEKFKLSRSMDLLYMWR